MAPVERSIPAKINLFLSVTGRREDGRHNISTIFLPLNTPKDRLEVSRTETAGIQLRVKGPWSIPEGDDNLVWRAAEAFAETAGIQAQWSFILSKAIPVAAGLGGGSADAAATLLALNDLHEGALDQADLAEIAGSLGADVPFFLKPEPALGLGVGDELEPIPLGCRIPLVLLNGGFPSSAGWAYANYRCEACPSPSSWQDLLQAMAAGDRQPIAELSYNALEFAVRRKFPLLEMMIQYLLDKGCTAAHVSGSGPTVFGLGSEKTVRSAAHGAKQIFGNQTWVCRTTVLAT